MHAARENRRRRPARPRYAIVVRDAVVGRAGAVIAVHIEGEIAKRPGIEGPILKFTSIGISMMKRLLMPVWL